MAAKRALVPLLLAWQAFAGAYSYLANARLSGRREERPLHRATRNARSPLCRLQAPTPARARRTVSARLGSHVPAAVDECSRPVTRLARAHRLAFLPPALPAVEDYWSGKKKWHDAVVPPPLDSSAPAVVADLPSASLAQLPPSARLVHRFRRCRSTICHPAPLAGFRLQPSTSAPPRRRRAASCKRAARTRAGEWPHARWRWRAQSTPITPYASLHVRPPLLLLLLICRLSGSAAWTW